MASTSLVGLGPSWSQRLRARWSGGLLLCHPDLPRHWDGALIRLPRTRWLGGPLGCRPWVLGGLGCLPYVPLQTAGPGQLPGSLEGRLLCLQGPWVSLLRGHPLAEGLRVPGGLYVFLPRGGARPGSIRRGYQQL